jgi:hypothetical protein
MTKRRSVKSTLMPGVIGFAKSGVRWTVADGQYVRNGIIRLRVRLEGDTSRSPNKAVPIIHRSIQRHRAVRPASR